MLDYTARKSLVRIKWRLSEGCFFRARRQAHGDATLAN